MRATPPESLPSPDPTKLTTEQTFREIGALRELVLREIASIQALMFLKIEGVSESVGFQSKITKAQFEQRDIALAAALAAAKEAVEKQNQAFDKATTKSETNFTDRMGAMEQRFNDLKDRFTVVEGRDQGKSAAGAHISTMVSLAIAVISLAFGLYMGLRKNG